MLNKFFGVTFFMVLAASVSSQADQSKPLPSDWQTAVCHVSVIADPAATTIAQKDYDIQRNDCATKPDQYSICNLNVKEAGAATKATQATISDKDGNVATITFSAIQNNLNLYVDNFGISLSLTDKNGKVITQLDAQRFVQVALPSGTAGADSRFAVECDPDVDYGPGN